MAPPDKDRCTAVVRIGSGKDDLADCMRRRVGGTMFCKQHQQATTEPHQAKKHARKASQ